MNVTPSTGAGRSRLLASAASVLGFAHLAGLAPVEGAAPRQEPTLAAPASAAGDAGGAPAEGKKHDERHGDGKFKPAENSGDGEGEDEDDDEDGDDDSDKKDMAANGSKSVRCARSRERARCAAILGAPEATRNVQLAAHLAFETNLPRSAAIAALKKGAASSAGGLAGRMAAVSAPNVGAGAERPTSPPRGAVSASWDRAMTKFRR